MFRDFGKTRRKPGRDVGTGNFIGNANILLAARPTDRYRKYGAG
jgi:hypothetical protein